MLRNSANYFELSIIRKPPLDPAGNSPSEVRLNKQESKNKKTLDDGPPKSGPLCFLLEPCTRPRLVSIGPRAHQFSQARATPGFKVCAVRVFRPNGPKPTSAVAPPLPGHLPWAGCMGAPLGRKGFITGNEIGIQP